MFHILTNGLLSSGWYVAGIIATGYISYYLREIVKKPLLACGQCEFRRFLEANMPLLQEKFWPTFWCYESRAQTVLASLLRSKILPNVAYRREILKLKDGGEVALDWKEETAKPDSPIVLLLPGLTGSSETDYVKTLAIRATKMGVRFVVFNNRGLGGMQLRTARLYCAANIEDVTQVINHVKKLHPHVPLGVVGISLGGLIVGNYLSNKKEEAKKFVSAVMLISVPWNVFVGLDSLEKPFLNYLLNRHLAFNLKKVVEERRQVLGPVMDYELVMKSKTIREFDANFTAKLFGYHDVIDYYSHASLHNKVHTIKVPTLCLSAADDPMQPLEGIPLAEASESDSLAILVTSRGGHIGFLEGVLPLNYDQYMARCFSQYFTAMFENDNYKLFTKELVVS